MQSSSRDNPTRTCPILPLLLLRKCCHWFLSVTWSVTGGENHVIDQNLSYSQIMLQAFQSVKAFFSVEEEEARGASLPDHLYWCSAWRPEAVKYCSTGSLETGKVWWGKRSCRVWWLVGGGQVHWFVRQGVATGKGSGNRRMGRCRPNGWWQNTGAGMVCVERCYRVWREL